MTKIWAHRGASGSAPENTLEAFSLAVEQKADGVELDVQLTKDGQIVVIHDETVNRVSHHRGYVKDFELKELRKINVNRPIAGYKEVFIPTLEEVYELLKETELTINVELKTSIIWYPQIEEKVLLLTKEMGMLERVIFSSFNHYSVRKIKDLEPNAKTGILYNDVLCEIAEYCKTVGADALHPAYFHRFMDTVFEEYLASQIPLHVWTVDGKEEMEYFIRKDIQAIITNYPEKARMVLERIERERSGMEGGGVV